MNGGLVGGYIILEWCCGGVVDCFNTPDIGVIYSYCCCFFVFLCISFAHNGVSRFGYKKLSSKQHLASAPFIATTGCATVAVIFFSTSRKFEVATSA